MDTTHAEREAYAVSLPSVVSVQRACFCEKVGYCTISAVTDCESALGPGLLYFGEPPANLFSNLAQPATSRFCSQVVLFPSYPLPAGAGTITKVGCLWGFRCNGDVCERESVVPRATVVLSACLWARSSSPPSTNLVLSLHLVPGALAASKYRWRSSRIISQNILAPSEPYTLAKSSSFALNLRYVPLLQSCGCILLGDRQEVQRQDTNNVLQALSTCASMLSLGETGGLIRRGALLVFFSHRLRILLNDFLQLEDSLDSRCPSWLLIRCSVFVFVFAVHGNVLPAISE